ncbi:MAG: restriction endonuclease subunit S [Alphaproteobacteria bacterium]|nr:MAG: restriction endonuclease subunit S [Alphaproteobacteria bacterium]
MFGDAVEIFDSKRVPLSNREREQRQGEFAYHGAASVMDHVDDYLFDGIFVLMGEDGSVTNPDGTPILQYVWGKFWVNNHAHVLQAKPPLSNEQLLLFLRRTNIASLVTGAVQAKLSQGNMKRIPYVKAPDPINKAFGELVTSLFTSIRSLSEESLTIRDTRNSLLPRLLTGSLSVPAEL